MNYWSLSKCNAAAISAKTTSCACRMILGARPKSRDPTWNVKSVPSALADWLKIQALSPASRTLNLLGYLVPGLRPPLNVIRGQLLVLLPMMCDRLLCLLQQELGRFRIAALQHAITAFGIDVILERDLRIV